MILNYIVQDTDKWPPHSLDTIQTPQHGIWELIKLTRGVRQSVEVYHAILLLLKNCLVKLHCGFMPYITVYHM